MKVRTQSPPILHTLVLLLLAASLVCTSCSSSPNMYKHKRNTDCGC